MQYHKHLSLELALNWNIISRLVPVCSISFELGIIVMVLELISYDYIFLFYSVIGTGQIGG